MKALEPNTVESSELVEQTFNFWFSDNEHIRSPFPEYIRPILKENAVDAFFKWVSNLNPKAKEEVNDEMIAEKFEEIIFETAMGLVHTEDEKITIQYPFLPRVDDEIRNNEEDVQLSKIIDRTLTKEGDTQFLKVKLENVSDQQVWETKFELPL
ncbi:MAG: hypothetical protein OQJ96_07130 [Flavobacteriales bacterium]|nr:hypothetical protein [Flavobacteriales bacterium]MCW8913571.1 hypothetical protein [Flavobacteriales bacterium]MCW8936618.1 hypothetical protein [Flavobacteriales bacterium]MCW8940273.1 hypothetical protein [Flavobacteriales bacterium]MCW8967873.1 hypothetical protein [Flavobacteriales bacterium]